MEGAPKKTQASSRRQCESLGKEKKNKINKRADREADGVWCWERGRKKGKKWGRRKWVVDQGGGLCGKGEKKKNS